LCGGSGNQVNFGLGHNTGGKEGKAPVGSIAGINPKVALAENAIRRANDHREFGGRRKGIQLQEDLAPGGTRCDLTLVRQ
jgi:hypothetical protein